MKKRYKTYLTLTILSILIFSCTKERYIDAPGNLVPKTVDQDATLPSISINGALLHSEAFGPEDSTLIICIHGGPVEITVTCLIARPLQQRVIGLFFTTSVEQGFLNGFQKVGIKLKAVMPLIKYFMMN